jgi:Cu(I)/Ag(I) efflux system membrane fusion protein
MTGALRAALVLAALVAAGTGGYWAGHRDPGVPPAGTTSTFDPTKPIIYYRDPDGKPLYSLSPQKTADGRAFSPVYASEDVIVGPTAKTAASVVTRQPARKRILYYRNPMGLPDVSKVPKKDSMGMDYIAVYEGEDDDSSAIKLSPGKVQRIGVQSEPAKPRVISEPVRAPGTIQLDERQIAVISMRAETFIEKVENVTTGSEVRKGEPLVRVYSPSMALAAADYVSALSMRADSAGLRGSRLKLINLGVPESVIAEIERTRQVPPIFTWVAPKNAIVLERNVVDGMRVAPGTVLFRLADISVVWALVDVSERDLGTLAQDQPVAVRVRSYPGRIFAGKIALIYPQINPATRTIRVRVELANSDLSLRPDMYAEATIDTGTGSAVLSVPESALIDSGDRQLVIIDKGEGRFEPRPVKIGRRGAGYVEIRQGVVDGEKVVTSANFLIDAESNLKAALKSLTGTDAVQ